MHQSMLSPRGNGGWAGDPGRFGSISFPAGEKALGKCRLYNAWDTARRKKAVAVRVFQELAKEVSVDLSVILMKD